MSSTVQHWGTFFGGASTLKPEDTTTSPASVSLPGPVAEVATSNSSEYALLTNGNVYAWGLGNAGQLGDGATKNSFAKPVRVRFPAGVKIASLPIDVMPFTPAWPSTPKATSGAGATTRVGSCAWVITSSTSHRSGCRSRT